MSKATFSTDIADTYGVHCRSCGGTIVSLAVDDEWREAEITCHGCRASWIPPVRWDLVPCDSLPHFDVPTMFLKLDGRAIDAMFRCSDA